LAVAYSKEYPLHFIIKGDDHQDRLTTDKIGEFIPKILTKYGKGQSIDVESTVTKISNLKLRNSDNTASCLLDVDVSLWVGKD